jgi:hypothetical protein
MDGRTLPATREGRAEAHTHARALSVDWDGSLAGAAASEKKRATGDEQSGSCTHAYLMRGVDFAACGIG